MLCPLQHHFVWTATDEEAKALPRAVAQLAENNGVAPIVFAKSAVVHARTLLDGTQPEDIEDTIRDGIIAFVLSMPTQQPDMPGTIGECLALFDFEVVFTKLLGRNIACRIVAYKRDDIAVSA